MVAQLIARAVIQAGKGAAKKAVSKKAAQAAGKGVARAKRAGDVATNARKRFYRAAERFLTKSEETSGSVSARFRSLARQEFEKALGTYDSGTTQRFSKPMQRLAKEFNVDLETARKTFTKQSADTLEDIEIKSRRSLESTRSDDDLRRELEAESVFNSKIGKRIFGGLVDIWREEATVMGKVDQSKIYDALYDYFGVDNKADLLDKIEEITGENLYTDDATEEWYETVKLTLQTWVASR